MKRIHWQISKLYMADDESKRSFMHPTCTDWAELNTISDKIIGFDKNYHWKLTTSDNRVYISKPDGDFFEVDTSVKTNDDTIYRKIDKESK